LAEKCVVAVGSTNPVKVNAVRRAFRLLCNAKVRGVSVESGVPAQPVGFAEVTRGAINRAHGARREAGADYGVGIEAGLVETEAEPIELQVAVIVGPGGRVSIGVSQGFMIPPAWVGEVRRRVELGEIAARETGRTGIGEKLGLIGFLTGGHVTRTDLTYNAVVMALIPWLNPDLYLERLPRIEELLRRLP
jgi:inosine/xanthosine triphosphatase